MIIFFVVIVCIIAILYLRAPAQSEVQSADTATSSLSAADIKNMQQITPLSDEATILTKNSSYIDTRNFLKDSDVRLYDEGSKTYLLDEALGVEGLVFQTFYASNGGLTISLLTPNISFARNQAEDALQKRLGLPLLEMCALTIRVTTPVWNNEAMSGRDLGLSFCPGSVAL